MINGAEYSAVARAMAGWHAQRLRDEWQCRLITETRGKNAAIVLALLANLYYECLENMLRVVGFGPPQPPMFSGFARIVATGHVTCDYIDRDYVLWRNALVYDTEDELIKEFRDIADRLKFSDRDRVAMFRDLKRWVSRDDRIKPSVEYKGHA